jgi:hypothetical protein
MLLRAIFLLWGGGSVRRKQALGSPSDTNLVGVGASLAVNATGVLSTVETAVTCSYGRPTPYYGLNVVPFADHAHEYWKVIELSTYSPI